MIGSQRQQPGLNCISCDEAYNDSVYNTLAFKKSNKGSPNAIDESHRCPNNALPGAPPQAAAARGGRRWRRPPAQPQHPTARAATTKDRSDALLQPKPRHRQKGRAPARVEERAARNDALNTPAEEEAARAFLAENAPWLVPGKVVKPPHLDENAPPTPPFTVPKPRLLVPPEDAEAGFESPEAFYGTAKVLPPEAPSPEDVAASINARAATPGSGWWWETDSAVLTCPGAGKRSSLCMIAIPTRERAPCSVGTWG